MPAYTGNPATPVQLAQKGVPCYLWGSLNLHQGNTIMLVNNVALTTNVATLTVQITAGEIPTVGSLISVAQTQTSAGVFNVIRAKLTAVTIVAATGAGTVTFALTNANIGSVSDTGSAIVEVPEVGETVAAGKSIPCVCDAPHGSSQFTVTTAVTFSTLPTAITVALQVALHDIEAEYSTIGNCCVVAGTAYTQGPVSGFTLQKGMFYRFIASGLTLGSGAGMVGKIVA
jgi:hypothetical protein